jgi:hypothetical protein
MARRESVALGGYYPTPALLIPRIARLLEPYSGEGIVSFVDPCAGEGSAVLALMKCLLKDLRTTSARLYSCEMEASRFRALGEATQAISWALRQTALHGDAFNISFDKGEGGGSVLFLNPPYDFDRVHGRLEHKFLTRFSSTLMEEGVLLFVVPFYALSTSAEFLATEYQDVQCFKFPDSDFEAYKQVVLFARKRNSLPEPDHDTVERILGWAKDASGLPELPNIVSKPLCEIPAAERYNSGFKHWTMRPVDLTTLVHKIRPWHQSARNGGLLPVHGVLSDLPIQDLLLRTYPVATPPRPAHIAAGIASGVFNGSRVEPTDTTLGLPSLLVKGVFDQEYRTVEEKLDKDTGLVRAVVQVQQPKLVTTVLDLTSHKYHTLKEGDSAVPDIETMTVSGLLKFYSESLMRVMEQQCPILYDPRKDGDAVPLEPTARKLYSAQAHASKAIVRLLGGSHCTKRQRRGKAAILLGEIGSGKTSVALSVANTIKSKRPLVVCPPHLLTSWTNEIAAVLPDADVRVLGSVADLEAVAQDTSDRLIISILSRETAKLSHGWIGVGAICPRCGGRTPEGEDFAKKRSRCENRKVIDKSLLARLATKLVYQLSQFKPKDPYIRSRLNGVQDRKRLAHFTAKLEKKGKISFPGFVSTYFDTAIEDLRVKFSEGVADAGKTIAWILLALGDHDKTLQVATSFLDTADGNYRVEEFGRQLLLMLPPNEAQQLAFIENQRSKNPSSFSPYSGWGGLTKLAEASQRGETYVTVAGVRLSWTDGVLKLLDVPAKTLSAALSVLSYLDSELTGVTLSDPCGGFLYQAVPEPRRVALAQHITKRYPGLFDFLVLDEAHEYATEGSAQERSAHRLTGLGLPTVLMTGTVMNGYAESLFMNMWAISPTFRKEFKRGDVQRFVDRYGYRKRILEDRNEEGEVVEFGSMSDRVTRRERIVGTAPGILPLFLLKHLLPYAVTLHKADLALDLPPCRRERHLINPNPELFAAYQSLQTALVDQIRKDQFDEVLAGKLFGQLAELPSYLDRPTADTGNTESGDYTIRYPESVGSMVVASRAPFDSSVLLPKEQWLLDTITAELAEGRNLMVFSWHVNLLPRLSRLISEHTGLKVPVLYANKVPTAKRQDWIDKNIVSKGVRVMVTNPVAIQTGLNNLVHFATEVWMENPACNPIIARQAEGRVDRIGQDLDTRIYYPIYAGTLQSQLYDLLMHKIAVSISTDGLDPESALLAAGVGQDSFLTGLSIGKQLWAMLSSGIPEEHGKVYKPASLKAPASDIFDTMQLIDEAR